MKKEPIKKWEKQNNRHIAITGMRNSEGGVILDPFVGSGTTCLAAKHLGLSYIGFEINPTYYQIAIDRLQGINQKGEMNLFDIDYD